MYIIFNVDFPKTLSEHSQQLLTNILPSPSENQQQIQQHLKKQETKRLTFQTTELDQITETRQHLENIQDDESSDDEQMPHGIPGMQQGVQCAQQ